MGQVVTFSDLSFREGPGGVKRAMITGADMKEMSAEVIRLAPEDTPVTLAVSGRVETTLLSVVAPPTGSAARSAGFSGGLAVSARATTPVHDVPEEKKRRIYFVGKDAARSPRAHAMIVEYAHDTVTSLHMHPNAESMFVFLSGKTCFTVNGRDVTLQRSGDVFPEGRPPRAASR